MKNVTTENLRRGNRAEPRLRWRALASLFAMCSVGSAVSAADLTVDGRAVETRDDSAYPRIGTLAPRCAPDPVDLLTGEVCAARGSMVTCAGGVMFLNVPAYDSPCVITERAAIDISSNQANNLSTR